MTILSTVCYTKCESYASGVGVYILRLFAEIVLSFFIDELKNEKFMRTKLNCGKIKI